jgi:hypothetical protein
MVENKSFIQNGLHLESPTQSAGLVRWMRLQ